LYINILPAAKSPLSSPLIPWKFISCPSHGTGTEKSPPHGTGTEKSPPHGMGTEKSPPCGVLDFGTLVVDTAGSEHILSVPAAMKQKNRLCMMKKVVTSYLNLFQACFLGRIKLKMLRNYVERSVMLHLFFFVDFQNISVFQEVRHSFNFSLTTSCFPH
jgi:hypothetical protein